jgi:hypothetical protein
MRIRSAAFFALAGTVFVTACLSSTDLGENEESEGEDDGPPKGYEGGGDADDGAGGEDGDGGGSNPTTSSGMSVICGDGTCAIAEDCASCPEDCTCNDPVCGDMSCDAPEDCMSCSQDCGSCANCGDDICGMGEDCDVCPQDCGVCACMPDMFEPNASSSAATNVNVGVDYCGLSICAGDFDWLEFSVNGNTPVTITFSHAEGDLDLEIYSSLTLEYVTGSYSADDSEAVMLSGVPAGAYWARIYGDGGAENPDYCFRAGP